MVRNRNRRILHIMVIYIFSFRYQPEFSAEQGTPWFERDSNIENLSQQLSQASVNEDNAGRSESREVYGVSFDGQDDG